MQFFADFFQIPPILILAKAEYTIWWDQQTLALGIVSFGLLCLFGFVVRIHIEKKETNDLRVDSIQGHSQSENQNLPRSNASKEIIEEKDLPLSKDRNISDLNSGAKRSRFAMPIQGRCYEAVRNFLSGLGDDSSQKWEVYLYDSKNSLVLAASKQGGLLVFSDASISHDNSEGMTWSLEYDGLIFGEVWSSWNFGAELSLQKLRPKLEQLTEDLYLAHYLQDPETGFGSALSFYKSVEKSREIGSNEDIIALVEFGDSRHLASVFSNLKFWCAQKYGMDFKLFRLKETRLAIILSTQVWLRFQKELPDLMEFLDQKFPGTYINIGASVRRNPEDLNWEGRAKEALAKSEEEGVNRLVCL
ncbi:hypothetical protein [Leptospira perolatii]|nr:hypothetical protein [Leptospira perolatii]